MRALRLLILGLAVGTGFGASAQTYPDKSKVIKIIVPFGPGGSVDLMGRALARGITETSGVNAIVENRAGAEGVIGVQAVKHSPPDGYTILLTSSSTQVLNVHMLPRRPYDPVADFIPLTSVAKTSQVMSAGPNVPFKTAHEFIAAARANPDKYTFGSGSTTTRLTAELLLQLAGIKLVPVPYKSVADSINGLAGGQVDIVFADLVGANPQIKAGRARPLAVTGTTRMASLPAVPTLKEEGVKDYEVSSWVAAYFPAKVPPAQVATMRELVRKASKSSYFTDVLKTFSMESMDISGDELARLQAVETDRWGKVVRAAKLNPHQ